LKIETWNRRIFGGFLLFLDQFDGKRRKMADGNKGLMYIYAGKCFPEIDQNIAIS